MGDHDALFKRAFGVPAHAAGELRSVLAPELVQHRIREVAPSLEKPMASAAEQLIQEGIVKGLAKGREEGREEALRVTLERLLQLRFGALDPPARTRIQAAPRAELDRLIERVVTAVTLEDVFAS